MYQPTFGTKQQIAFNSEEEFYEFLGYLCKNDNTTKIVWEDNHDLGAWADEGRIHFYVPQPALLRARLSHTAGRSSILSRVNCNEFVLNIISNHGFVPGGVQNLANIQANVPAQYLPDFNIGQQL